MAIAKENDANVYLVFKNKNSFDSGLDELLSTGFPAEKILTFESHQGNLLDDPKANRLGSGLIYGAIGGILIGLVLTLFFGFHVFSAISPKINHIFSLVAGAIVGAMIGTPVGALIGQFLPEKNISSFKTSLQEGGIVIELIELNESERKSAIKILNSHGGQNVFITPMEITSLVERYGYPASTAASRREVAPKLASNDLH